MKAKIKDQGIITQISPYGDSSLIIRCFSKMHGSISILAKGLRKSSAHNPLIPLYEYEFSLYEPLEPGLYLLSEASLNAELNLHHNPVAWVAGELAAELMNKLLIPPSEAPEYYDVLRAYLNYLQKPGIVPICIWWRFFSRILSLSGYEMNLSSCEICGREELTMMIMDLHNAGLLCRECAESRAEDSLLILSPKAYHILQILPEIGLHMEKLKPTRAVVNELNTFFLQALSGRINKTLKLNSLSVLTQFYPD